jgi:hypothetical protein
LLLHLPCPSVCNIWVCVNTQAKKQARRGHTRP